MQFLRSILAAVAAMLFINTSLAQPINPPINPYEGVVDEPAIAHSRALIAAGGSSSFVEPLATFDPEGWTQYLADIRSSECSQSQAVVSFVEQHYTADTPEHAQAVKLAEAEGSLVNALAVLAMREQVQQGMSSLCLAVILDLADPEGGLYVLLTPEGDQIFGYEDGIPVSPLSKLDRRYEDSSFDTLVIGNQVTLTDAAMSRWSYVGLSAFGTASAGYEFTLLKRELDLPTEMVDILPTPAPRS